MGGSRIVVEWARGPKVCWLCIILEREELRNMFCLQYDYRQDYERHKRERNETRGSCNIFPNFIYILFAFQSDHGTGIGTGRDLVPTLNPATGGDRMTGATNVAHDPSHVTGRSLAQSHMTEVPDVLARGQMTAGGAGSLDLAPSLEGVTRTGDHMMIKGPIPGLRMSRRRRSRSLRRRRMTIGRTLGQGHQRRSWVMASLRTVLRGHIPCPLVPLMKIERDSLTYPH